MEKKDYYTLKEIIFPDNLEKKEEFEYLDLVEDPKQIVLRKI